jgi:hypothetical protein
VVAGPNFRRFNVLLKRAFRIGAYRKLRRFEESGVSLCGPATLASHIRNAGLGISAVRWVNHEFAQCLLAKMRLRLGGVTAKDWLLQARRNDSRI